MTAAIVRCGFLGAWLLAAGPLYQGAIELLEQHQASAEGRLTDLPAPPRRHRFGGVSCRR